MNHFAEYNYIETELIYIITFSHYNGDYIYRIFSIFKFELGENEMTEEKIWTKNFIIISCINFLAIFMFYLLMVTIATYSITTYHVPTSVAGLVASIFIIGALIGRLGAGRLISTINPPRMLGIGLVIFLLSSFLYFIEIGVIFLLMVRLLQGIALGIIGTSTGTMIAYILPNNRKGEGIGYFTLSAILATAVGPFIGIFMLRFEYGFLLIFAMNAILTSLMLIVYSFVKLNISIQDNSKNQSEPTTFIAKYIEPKALPISFIALIIGFTYSGVMSLLSFYAKEINLVDAASFFFLTYAIVIIFSRPYAGKLMDQRGPNIIVYPCLIFFSIGMILFSQATNGWMLLFAAALIGLGYGNFNSIAQTIAIKVTDPSRYGLATSTYYILFDIGLGVGPFLLGLVEPFTTYRMIFLAMAPIIMICIPLYYILHGKKAANHSIINGS